MQSRASFILSVACSALIALPSLASTPLYVQGTPEPPATLAAAIKPAPMPSLATIDVLVVVDSRFSNNAYATPQAWAQAQIDYTNDAFQASQVNAHLNLVGVHTVSNVPNVPMGLEIQALINPVDHTLDDVHVLREVYGADIVLMWSDKYRTSAGADAERGFCGLSGFDVGQRAPAEGMAIVQPATVSANDLRDCVDKDFAHELGHLLAADHPISQGPSPNSDPYARGMKVMRCQANLKTGEAPGCIWDIMSSGVASGCTDLQGNSSVCRQISHYSNPNVQIENSLSPTQPIATGTAIENNVATMNASVHKAAAIRQPASPTPTALNTGIWYSPYSNRAGHGIMFSRVPGDRFVAVWFTYRADGTPIWYISDPEPMRGSVWTAKIMETRMQGEVPDCPEPNPQPSNRCHVGRITLSLTSPTDGNLYWQLPGPHNGLRPTWIGGHVGERISYRYGGGDTEGLYYHAAESGWGYHLSESSILGQNPRYIATVYYYAPDGRPTWSLGAYDGTGALSAVRTFNMGHYTSQSLCPGCAGGPGCQAGSSQCPVGGSGTQATTSSNAGQITLVVDPWIACGAGYGIRGNFQIGSTTNSSVSPWYRPDRETCQISTR